MAWMGLPERRSLEPRREPAERDTTRFDSLLILSLSKRQGAVEG